MSAFRVRSRMQPDGPGAACAVSRSEALAFSSLNDDALYVQASAQVAQRVEAMRCGRIRASYHPVL